ncbi:hypothetical protein GGR38_003262 [Novosphingobium sediminicola]|uniref:Uncharacterized protein n=1 Tax=Novosphingobium sediminicola TaxID=563162 RepID=A0A7W6CKH1_9SPHN|nr:hypothetical protein [Novosphingobium sediminicola]
MFILLSCVGIIWVVRCDPKKPHYRLPAIATVVGPLIALVIALTKLR